jgi:hypothetical protein
VLAWLLRLRYPLELRCTLAISQRNVAPEVVFILNTITKYNFLLRTISNKQYYQIVTMTRVPENAKKNAIIIDFSTIGTPAAQEIAQKLK